LRIGLLVYKRILLGGIASVVFRGDFKLIKDPVSTIVDTFEDSYDSNSLFHHPQFLGLFNNLANKLSSLLKFKNSGGIGLYNISKNLASLDYSTIYNKDKEKLIPLLTMGKLVSKSFNILPIMSSFIDFDSEQPERMFFYAYYDLIDHALRSIAFK
jgi:hypothetical protein